MEDTIKWGDKELKVREFQRSHANGGRLGKFWVEDINTGRMFMVKGCTPFGYEPISEKIAYVIGKNLGIDVLEYDVLPSNLFKGIIDMNPFCRYVSICEKIDTNNCSLTSIATIKRARNVTKKPDEPNVTNKQLMFELLDSNYIDTMILFDAIIGNVDRHYGNVHILRDKDGNLMGAPLLDNGASLLAMQPTIICRLAGKKIYSMFNKSSTMEKNHDKQIEYIQTLRGIRFDIVPKTVKIMEELKPTIALLPKGRAQLVEKYIVYRLHKYLGFLRHEEYFDDEAPDTQTVTKKEKEHT